LRANGVRAEIWSAEQLTIPAAATTRKTPHKGTQFDRLHVSLLSKGFLGEFRLQEVEHRLA
jgi:hypothetical protein